MDQCKNVFGLPAGFGRFDFFPKGDRKDRAKKEKNGGIKQFKFHAFEEFKRLSGTHYHQNVLGLILPIVLL